MDIIFYLTTEIGGSCDGACFFVADFCETVLTLCGVTGLTALTPSVCVA